MTMDFTSPSAREAFLLRESVIQSNRTAIIFNVTINVELPVYKYLHVKIFSNLDV